MEQIPAKHPIQAEFTLPPADCLQLFKEENVQFVILDLYDDVELVEAIRLQPNWKVDFEDDELVIFTLSKRH